jgi:hypothetical protein
MDKYNSKFARWVGELNDSGDRFAVTVSSTCTLYSCDSQRVTETWRKHENIHKEQIKRLGWIRFMVTYFYYNMRIGYQYNPFEVEARNGSLE